VLARRTADWGRGLGPANRQGPTAVHARSHYWGDTLGEGTFAVGGAEPLVYICAFSPAEGYPPVFKDWHMCGCCYQFNSENATSFAGYCTDSKGVCQTLCDVTTVSTPRCPSVISLFWGMDRKPDGARPAFPGIGNTAFTSTTEAIRTRESRLLQDRDRAFSLLSAGGAPCIRYPAAVSWVSREQHN
jgi:hypothetical protein